MINEISKDFFDAYRNNGRDVSEGMISVQSMPVAQALGDALKRKKTPTAIFAMGGGMPDAIRTHDLQSRSLTLYPTELRAHIQLIYYIGYLRLLQGETRKTKKYSKFAKKAVDILRTR